MGLNYGVIQPQLELGFDLKLLKDHQVDLRVFFQYHVYRIKRMLLLLLYVTRLVYAMGLVFKYIYLRLTKKG